MNDLVRIAFELNDSAKADSGMLVERLWAEQLSVGRYVIRNIPFFAEEVAPGDVVAAVEAEDGLRFDRVLEFGPRRVIWVIFQPEADEALQESLLQAMKELGLDMEHGRNRFWAFASLGDDDFERALDLMCDEHPVRGHLAIGVPERSKRDW